MNAEAARNRPKGIISNPNCTTLSMIVAMGALHHRYELEQLVVASYQAASGAGQDGIDALYDQLMKVAGNRDLGTTPGDVRRVIGNDLGPFPAPLALNVVPWAGSLKEDGWSSEELKVRNESRKILGLPDLKVSATCVRVPVDHHARCRCTPGSPRRSTPTAPASTAGRSRRAAVRQPGRGRVPDPADVVGTDPTWVGRLRKSLDDPNALELFVCGDNLRKGAALNAAQIAEVVAKEFTAAAS